MFLQALLKNSECWRGLYPQQRTFLNSVRIVLSSLCAFGRRTLTNGIVFSGRQQQDWSSDYKLYSRSNWDESALFLPIIEKSLQYCDNDYIAIGVDDTKIKKTGKKIPFVGTYRDPLSPAYHVNLVHGHRILQTSLLLPIYNQREMNEDKLNNLVPSARGIPINFINVPTIKKPGKKATEEEVKIYKEEKKNYNLSIVFGETAKKTRENYSKLGYKNNIIFIGDGSFCNKTVFSLKIDKVSIATRCRKDTSLCFEDISSSRRFYSEEKFTPQSVFKDEAICWTHATAIMGRQSRPIKYKETKDVFWQRGSGKKRLRLIVIAPYPYRISKKGKFYYRKEAYILTDDQHLSAERIIQMYIDRWEIEVNHRDEKTILGIGEAQLWNEKSVIKQPVQLAAMYSMMILTSLECFGIKRTSDYLPYEKWRKKSSRPSCNDLINLLRKGIEENYETMEKYGFKRNDLSKYCIKQ